MLEFFKDLWEFALERKKWFLFPVILVLILIGTILVFTEGSAVGAFIYTLF